MGTYTLKGWYGTAGGGENVHETVNADDNETASRIAREVFDHLDEGGGYNFQVINDATGDVVDSAQEDG